MVALVMSLRVAVLTTVHPAQDARILYKESASLARAGHQVTLFAQNTPGAGEQAAALNVRYVPLMRVTARAQRHRIWRQLYAQLKAGARDFDVWHFHDPELLPLAIVWRRLINPRVRLVCDAHEHVPKNLRSRQWLPAPLRRPVSTAFAALERWCVRRCDLVVAATEGIAEHLAIAAPGVVIVRNYPLPLHEQPPRAERSRNELIRCIYSGGMMPTRGIRELLTVFGGLDPARYHLTLLGPFFAQAFEDEIRTAAPSNVTVASAVAFPEVAARLALCDIGMMTLLPTENHLDSLPIKLFEYMQLGLPVIGSNFPLWRRIIEDADCGLTVDPTDIAAISAAIRQLGKDAGLRARMARSAVMAANAHYTWHSQELALLDAYQQLRLSPGAASARAQSPQIEIRRR
jgi:glycosyltransferase involved in cell wall biosynthesis